MTTFTPAKTYSDSCQCCDRDIHYQLSDIGANSLIQCEHCECERFACSLCMAGNGGDCIAFADDPESVCVSAIDVALENLTVREVVSA